jgi:hypothetical protein
MHQLPAPQAIAVEQDWLDAAYAQTDAAHGVVDDITEKWRYEGDKLVCERTQDVEPYLDANKAAYNSVSDWRPFANCDSRMVADIPNVIIEKWIREGFNIFDEQQPDYQKKLRQRLNSNEYRFLRVTPGRI